MLHYPRFNHIKSCFSLLFGSANDSGLLELVAIVHLFAMHLSSLVVLKFCGKWYLYPTRASI
jgi:hypothetical protein